MRIWPCLLALMLLAPTALAAPSFQAASVSVAGSTEISADGSALYAMTETDAFTWEITAASAEILRTFSPLVGVRHPVNGEWLYSKTDEWQTATDRFEDVTMTSTGNDVRGAILALGPSAQLASSTDGSVSIKSVLDPPIDQQPKEAAAEGADDLTIQTTLAGSYLLAQISDGEATFVGDLTVILFGPDYLLTSSSGTQDEQTGDSEGDRAGPVVTNGHRERQEITLQDAVLRIRSTEALELYTILPEVTFSGALSTQDAEGALTLGSEEIAVPASGALTWMGDATLHLAPQDGGITVVEPVGTLATTGAIVDSGPRIAIVSAALAVLAIAALAALVVWRMRSRRDDLATAILAMEERRWFDALPPLTRLAKKEPNNANILVDRALVLEELGRVREAAGAFEKALRAAPRHAEAHFYYARTLAKMRESEAARVHLETALERDPRLVELARGEKILRGL